MTTNHKSQSLWTSKKFPKVSFSKKYFLLSLETSDFILFLFWHALQKGGTVYSRGNVPVSEINATTFPETNTSYSPLSGVRYFFTVKSRFIFHFYCTSSYFSIRPPAQNLSPEKVTAWQPDPLAKFRRSASVEGWGLTTSFLKQNGGKKIWNVIPANPSFRGKRKFTTIMNDLSRRFIR